MAASVKGRFQVLAVSRHPRRGRDYDPVTHRYSDHYVKPRSYVIEVDAFPGKRLRQPRGDQQLQPGGDPKTIRDIWELLVPRGTTGYEFSIEGTVIRERSIRSPLRQKFSAKETKRLITTSGIFREDRDDNVWNWRVEVPGPGEFEVTVKLLNASVAGSVRTHQLRIRDFLVVSIGDSAASGQGNPDVPGEPEGYSPDISWWEYFVPPLLVYELSKEALDWGYNRLKQKATTIARAKTATIDMDPAPVWQEPKAYRSLRSGHARAARRLEDLSSGRVVTFLPFGRTGSEIVAGLLDPRGASEDEWIDGLGQVAEVERTLSNKRIDALLIYIGVNDVGVAGRLEQVLTLDPISATALADAKDLRDLVEAMALNNMAKIPGNLDKLKTAISERLNVRHVYLTEYPTALFDGTNGEPTKGCGIFSSDILPLDLTGADARLIRELAEKLNDLLKSEAKRLGWFYISGIAARFQGHGYCTGDDRFFVQAEESLVLQGDTEGTIHPNPAGTAIIGGRVAAAVTRNTINTTGDGFLGDQDPVLGNQGTTPPRKLSRPAVRTSQPLAGAGTSASPRR